MLESRPAAVHVLPLRDAMGARWDEFVRGHAQGTFFHLSGWRQVLERAFGHRTHYLVAQREGVIEGVLPLARVRSLLFGDALISTPFCVYGGALYDSADAKRALEDSACALAEELGVDYLEMRNRSAQRADWPRKELYVTFRRPLDADSERNMQAIPRKQRAMVRKGIAAGLVSEIDPDVSTLYGVYSESVRNLGTPVFARRYLKLLREVFAADCEVLNVMRAGRCVASVMSFFFRDEVLPYYGGGTHEARAWAANDFMYWEVMRRAAERGVRVFDFGRSKRDSGSFRFKTHWGFEPEPLHYEYHLVRARAMPDLSPVNSKYQLMVRTWQRLPLAITRVLGPPLARHLG
jgi:FemAB-related protein (PEP-CTERM system-associated)